MKINKAAGPDEIVIEMPRAKNDCEIDEFTEVINEINDNGEILDLPKSIVISLMN